MVIPGPSKCKTRDEEALHLRTWPERTRTNGTGNLALPQPGPAVDTLVPRRAPFSVWSTVQRSSKETVDADCALATLL
jgi:hypothetical protein